jgi:hypothetical protein
MNGKGFERDVSWPNQCTIPECAWNGREKSRETSVWIAGVLAEIRNEGFPNMRVEHYRYSSEFALI